MKSVCELAYDAVVASNIVSKKNVAIDAVVYSDWDGVARIKISEGDSAPEEGQMGPIAQTTPLTVAVFDKDRDKALQICKAAADAIYKAIENLERKPGSGILAILRGTNGVSNTVENKGFAAFRTFNVINTIF